MDGREADQLVEEIGRMFEACRDDVVEQMNLVDVLPRLGIDHHFEEQINTTLRNIHSTEFYSSNLHEVTFRFRLLRQQGYWVSPGARMMLTKKIMLISLLDDTYDVHATLEEARKFNEALQRWDKNAISLVPEGLKRFFLSIMSNFRDFEDELEPYEKYRNAYNINAFQILSNNYLQEAEWFHQKYIPSFTEHAAVSLVTGGAIELPVSIIVGMGDIATKDAFDWALSCPDAGRAFGEVSRFMDDLAVSQNGREKMDVANAVGCYMKEHGVTSDVAEAEISEMVEGAWKTLNQTRFENRVFLPFVQRIANVSMSIALLFHGKRDGYTNSHELKDMFESHFVNPIPLNRLDAIEDM
uniref:Terpene synthase metal-binding domain-containing protein n=1 Tax=Oryza punctata TaxID=4537 RepID=A0A0E0JL29_ORYPU